MTFTLQTRFAIALTSLGFKEQKPTARYRVYRGYHARLNSLNGETPIERTYYLGTHGALRWSSTHRVSDSRECATPTRDRLLAFPAVPNKETKGFLIRE